MANKYTRERIDKLTTHFSEAFNKSVKEWVDARVPTECGEYYSPDAVNERKWLIGIAARAMVLEGCLTMGAVRQMEFEDSISIARETLEKFISFPVPEDQDD